jgi:hypothetical protein
MEVSEAATVDPTHDLAALREGIQESRLLLTGRDGALNNYRLTLSHAVTDWSTPRHHHNFDQIRLPLTGEFVYAKDKVLPAGWVGYFPEGVYYGPQIRKAGLLMLLCQFGGASGSGFMSKSQRKVGLEALKAKGFFEKGAFTYIDAAGQRHRQDAYEAMWEAVMGRELTYPQPRYNEIITINPENFDWEESGTFPGMSVKSLGSFTERNTRMGFVHLDRGAQFAPGKADAPQVLFLTKGSVVQNGREYPIHTSFGLDQGESSQTIKATEPSEFFFIDLPRF